MRALALGENKKSDVKKERGGLREYGKCIFCDEIVWGSGKGYTPDKLNQDASVEETYPDAIIKPLHKSCLVELVEIGKNFMQILQMKHETRRAN